VLARVLRDIKQYGTASEQSPIGRDRTANENGYRIGPIDAQRQGCAKT
jgi:hypothetical protein